MFFSAILILPSFILIGSFISNSPELSENAIFAFGFILLLIVLSNTIMIASKRSVLERSALILILFLSFSIGVTKAVHVIPKVSLYLLGIGNIDVKAIHLKDNKMCEHFSKICTDNRINNVKVLWKIGDEVLFYLKNDSSTKYTIPSKDIFFEYETKKSK